MKSYIPLKRRVHIIGLFSSINLFQAIEENRKDKGVFFPKVDDNLSKTATNINTSHINIKIRKKKHLNRVLGARFGTNAMILDPYHTIIVI